MRRSARILAVSDRRRGRARRSPAVARHAARREPTAAARPRLRAGARRRHDYARRRARGAEAARSGRARVRRDRSQAACGRSSTSSAAARSASTRIAAAISEEKDAIEDIYEPFLIQIGFLDRTPRGRVATPRAYGYFGLDAPGKGLTTVVAQGHRTIPRGTRCGGRPTTITSLATYVPPRLLTNADLEKTGRHDRRVDSAANRHSRAAHRRSGRGHVRSREGGGASRRSSAPGSRPTTSA